MNSDNTSSAAFEQTKEKKLPLCVDLDGTLIKTDSLHELLLKFIKNNPLKSLLVPFWILSGKAAFKARLTKEVELQPALLPYNEKVLDYMKEQSDDREVYLCTGANEAIAKPIADYVGGFDGVIASNGDVNVTGKNKSDLLNKKFGKGAYAYIGNASIDYNVWDDAGEIAVTSSSSGFISAVEKRYDNVTSFKLPGASPRSLIKAVRLHQWVKNSLLFVPLLIDHKIANVSMVIAAVLGFLSFSLMASATYLINDLLDLEADRAHPKKSKRPFASGTISAFSGVKITIALFALSIALLFFVPWEFSIVAGVYLVSTLLYSFHVKSMVILDACLLAGLFTIRVIGGTVLIANEWSFWLLAFSMFLFVSLAFTKRAAELYQQIQRDVKHTAGRAYRTDDYPLIVSMGVSSGFISVLVIALYVNSVDVVKMYTQPEVLWLICPLLMYWIGRIWLKTVRGQMNEDPIVFAIKDRISHITAILAVIVVGIAA
ncbi:UbiA family prenyltransferase [Pelagicoccus albus]|uniref:UbiA family prenyltransferase n=1 Tax=Pelagicoccus albus TaxID=415222 RepID=A0A7X1EAC6_9BACT|nr:UbiA family prenyltransferase [Pelagicoccus albus]MBC2608256.1 UbiA family prenyltransferase [Pelagicoccus albus]